jgi:small-conductance mechanosensitive channel/CRP-like cAMP-binding protein
MGGPANPNMVFFLEVVFFLLAMACALALYALLRIVVSRTLVASSKPAGFFLVRLILPAVFILATLSFRLPLIRRAFPFGPKFYLFIDAALVFFLAFFVIRLINAALLTWYARRQAPFPVPRVLHGFILGVIYLVILFAVFKRILGINITPFLATSAILTMILGLALQGVLSNILAGMSLHFTKSFNRGEWIKVKDIEGVVLETNWRETRILDRASNIVVIPNSIISAEPVTNFSQPDRKTALVFSVRASFGAPPAAVQEALLETARDVPEILSTPTPLAYVLKYDDYGVSYALKFWVAEFARKEAILSTVGRLVWYKFERRGIEIPIPVSERVGEIVTALRKTKPAGAAEEPGDGRSRNLRDLVDSSFLRYSEGRNAGQLIVPQREIQELAQSARRRQFTAGEVLCRQGDRGESAFVVASGLVRGEIIYEEKGKKYSSEFRVGPGGIFGEMSLFTGLPRTATGTIEQEAELLEVGGEDFGRLLGRSPGLAEVMAGIVAERNKRNSDFLAKIKELSSQDIASSCSKKSVLERLRSLIRTHKSRS